MHIVTGLVLAALLGKSSESDSLAPLRTLTTGPIRVAHAIPGRVRFVVPSLRGASADRLAGIQRLESVDGIESIETSAISGSVVVRYRPAQIDPPLLLGAVARLLGLEAELERTPTPAVAQEFRLMAQSLNRAVFYKTHGLLDLWSVMALVLMAIGGKKIITEGWRALPAGFTLLWWGLHAVRGREDGQA